MHLLVWSSVVMALTMLAAVVIERVVVRVSQIQRREIERIYEPFLRRALAGDQGAIDKLANAPVRYRLAIAHMLVTPLFLDHDPAHIAAARGVAHATFQGEVAGKLLRSRRWWHRALGLRGVGVLQYKEFAPAIVAALDDRHPDVRSAALDALADLHDPATLPAIVVRLTDHTLERGRRAAALDAFGSEAEPLVLDLAEHHPEHRLSYARALAICGTARARPVLGRWTRDDRAEVRAAALSALGRIGLDDESARLALQALDDEDALVRAKAAKALGGWTGGDAPARLARHLDDEWSVAVPAARSLQAMGEVGRHELEVCAARPGLPGLLARQMLWQARDGIAS